MRIHVQGKTEPTTAEKIEALWKKIAEGKSDEESGIEALKTKSGQGQGK
jgi:hypothetical protein